jgi:hypothetical protein
MLAIIVYVILEEIIFFFPNWKITTSKYLSLFFMNSLP